jgi:hypothetical protein
MAIQGTTSAADTPPPCPMVGGPGTSTPAWVENSGKAPNNKKNYGGSALAEDATRLSQLLGKNKTDETIVLDTDQLIRNTKGQPAIIDKKDLAAIQTATKELSATVEFLKIINAKIDTTTKALAKELPALRENLVKEMAPSTRLFSIYGEALREAVKENIKATISRKTLEIDKDPDLAQARKDIKNSALSLEQKDDLNKKIDDVVSNMQTSIGEALDSDKLIEDAEQLMKNAKS